MYFKIYLRMYVYVCIGHVSAGALKDQKSESLELELHEVVSGPIWVLGAEPGSAARIKCS